MPDPRRISATIAAIEAMGAGPHRVADVCATGVTLARVRACVASGELIRLRRGIVIPARPWQAASEIDRRAWALAAAVMAFPGSFGSHGTAALIRGLPDYGSDVIGDPPTTHITRMGASRIDGWIRVHGCDTPPTQVDRVTGVPVTSLARTSIDMAATGSLRRAVVFMDAAMRLRVVELAGESRWRERAGDASLRAALFAEWDAEVAPFGRHRWVTKVREAIRLADPCVESVAESLSRVGIIEHGLPVPRCGVPVVGDNGVRYWADMVWDRYRLIGEVDGLGKYDSVERLVGEKRRQEALEAVGWSFVRWGLTEVQPSPEPMIRRIRAALERCQQSTRLHMS